MKSIFLFLILGLCSISYSQCWQSLDVDGDTNSVHYAIQNNGTLWQLSPNGIPTQLGFNKNWKKAYTSGGSGYSTFLIADDSTLWGFGENYYGQLGIGNTNYQPTLIQLNSSKWISLSSSWGHTTAIKADGTMWFWGGSWTNPVLFPTQIGIDNNWKELHTDYSNVIAQKNNGTIWFGNVGGTLSQVGSETDWNYIWIMMEMALGWQLRTTERCGKMVCKLELIPIGN
jgi:hypothetical protein